MPLDLKRRGSGVLMHISSLPGPVGLGDLGPSAHAFASWLAQAGQRWWQTLPVNPMDSSGSPYQSPSAFAGEPLFISLERLGEDGWLEAGDLSDFVSGTAAQADPHKAAALRWPLLRKAWRAFQELRPPAAAAAFEDFCEEQSVWLEDYALFAALKRDHQGRPWTQWEPAYRDRQAPAMEQARRLHADEIGLHRFLQWQFHRQWLALKSAANDNGIGLIGDVPIFVAQDSADVWAARELFDLDDEGRPRHVAGVPPDYFSAEGQLWGNPLYRWDLHRATAYRWWVGRFWRILQLFDLVRVDHFIGFHRYWEVPADAPSALTGRYQAGPGAHFFEVLRDQLGSLPVIAEDLGVLTPEVTEMRRGLGIPGMQVIQFCFGDGAVDPLDYPEDCVAYTGTHDNDTVRGWLESGTTDAGDGVRVAHDEERRRALAFAARHDPDPVKGLIEGVWATHARLAIAPVQDFLNLGSEARMNIPGTVGGHNWRFRIEPGALTPELALGLLALTQRHQRG
jgi:4-alpha-glucanotransferase